MKIKSLIIIFSLLSTFVNAQLMPPPGTSTNGAPLGVGGPKRLEIKEKKQSVAEIYAWRIDENNLDTFKLEFDTAFEDFFNYYPIFRNSIANAHLGNLGSPYQSMVYFDRPQNQPFLFMDVYREYMKMPEDYRFYNTKTPYTSLNYWTGGPKLQAEEQVKLIHSRNIGKDINITGYGDYVYGRGFYDRLSTKHLNFSVSTSLLKPRYSLYFIGGLNNLENFENGGFTDDRYIYDPVEITGNSRGATEYSTFQVNLNDARSQLKNRFLYLNHEYRLGFKRDLVKEDTVIQEFVAINSFGHSFTYNEFSKNYVENNPNSGFYENVFVNNKSGSPGTQDSTYRRVIENKLKVYFEEGLNKYMPFGFGVYLKNELIKERNNAWSFIPDSVFNVGYSEAKTQFTGLVADSARFEYMRNNGDTIYSNTSVGGQIFRRKGKNFFFEAGAELYFLGYRQGDYRINGEMTKWFAVIDSTSLKLSADFTRTTPDNLLNRYHSNHFWWNNNFDAVFEQRLQGELSIPAWNAELRLKLNTIVNYIYYDSLANPNQYTTALPILEFSLLKNFTLGKFHWDNQLTYQATGNSYVLPLPDLALRSNLYYKNKLFDVLWIQLGLDTYFNTPYFTPAYMPATGRFYSQNERELGSYPLAHFYGNFQLKRMRFFLMYYHVNKDLLPPYHFSALHYGANPRFFKIGVSWNFYD